jgi:hypothetical protein
MLFKLRSFKGAFLRSFFSGLAFSLFILNVPLFSQDTTAEKAIAPAFAVYQMVFAANIQSRSPVGINTVFQSSIGQVSCWTKLAAAKAPVLAKYIWYKDGEKVFEWAFNLKFPLGCIWCTKSVDTGNWKVEVVDSSGNLAKSGTFVVK